MFHAAALFEDDILHAAFHLKKHRCLRVIAVVAKPQFETVFVPVHRSPVDLQLVVVEIQTMHGIGIVRLPDTVLVHVQVTAHEVAHFNGGMLRDQILQLEAGLLHSIPSHKIDGQNPVEGPLAVDGPQKKGR